MAHMDSNPKLPKAESISQLIHQSRTPLVFHGRIQSWPMLGYSTADWANLFGAQLLDCRVGLRYSDDGDEPQWEGRSVTLRCTYTNLVKWSREQAELKISEEGGLLDPSQHFLYFGYQYMKDLFGDNKDILRAADWTVLGQAGRDGTQSTFWLGTAGSHTPCHYDTYGCNLVAQISGRKRWILYPPEDTSRLEASRIPYEESSVYSRINFERYGMEGVPQIEGTRPHIVVLEPGDVLYVPRHWWHHVTNLDQVNISINTWLEREEDEEARFQEGLVKFLVGHVSRNLPSETVLDLLNPNEMEMAEADLEEIQGFIRHSAQRLAVKRNSGDGLQSTTAEEAKSVKEMDHLTLSEPWIMPVACCAESHPIDGKLGFSSSSSTEEEVVQNKAHVTLPSTQSEVGVLDVVRAFCHPEVIQLVSRLLQK